MDYTNGDLWVAIHTTTNFASPYSNWSINQYDSNLNLISSTPYTPPGNDEAIYSLTFSNWNGVKVLYAQYYFEDTVIKKFDITTLTFAADINPGLGAFHMEAAVDGERWRPLKYFYENANKKRQYQGYWYIGTNFTSRRSA